MTRILFNGCSFTQGDGLDNESNNPELWVNQIASMCFENPEVTNISASGKNNHWIFVETLSALTQQSYDVVIVGWTDTNRLNFNVGLETYPTMSLFGNHRSINLHSHQTVERTWLNETGNRIRKYQNAHWGILDLVKYVNILVDYQVKQKNSKIFFVNSLCHWSNRYFEYVDYEVPSDLSSFYSEILEIDFRNNAEIKQLYSLIHSQYSKYGGIRPEHWLNLYNSLLSKQIDNASAVDYHPGIASQHIYAKYLAQKLKEKL
jgi:hypothetical protein